MVLAMAVLGVGLVGLSLGQEKKEPEKKFAPKDGKFTVQFPSAPQATTKSAGKAELHIYSLAKEKEKVNFVVIYSDMPADVIKGSAPEAVLKTGEEGLVNFYKAKVTKATDTKFKAGGKEYPAREILADKGDGQLRLTLVLAGNRLYQVLVLGTKEQVSGKEADDFFKSFEITG